MLILLSEEFHWHLSELIGEPRFRRAMGNLLLAHRDGKHIVSAPTSVLNDLIRLTNGDEKGEWRKIKLERPKLGVVQENVTHICIVVPEQERRVQRKQTGGQIHLHVPYTYFDDFESAGSAHLVAEDQDDADLYLIAARAYVAFSPDLQGTKVILHCFGGGGGNINDAFRAHARHSFTLGIVDSDKKWPSAALGKTCMDLQEVLVELEREGRSLAELIVLPCHELENLLPAALIIDSFIQDDDADFRNRCVDAERLKILGAAAPLHHLDIKRGLTLYDVFDARRNAQKHAFLSNVAHQQLKDRSKCTDEPECAKREHCQCRVFDGLGDKIAARVVEYCRKLSAPKNAEYLLAFHVPCRFTWLEICRRVFSFGCAYPRSRV